MRKNYPRKEDVAFILCDDIRREGNGKITLLGIYASDEISVGREKDEGSNIEFQELSFYFTIKAGEGDFKSRAKICYSPENQSEETIFDEEFSVIKKKDGVTAVAGFKISPIVLRSYGKYKVTLTLDDNEFTFPFFIKPHGRED